MEHGLPYLANCSLLFTEEPLLERPAAARAAGFEAIELWWPFATASPPDSKVDALVGAVRDAGVRLVALNVTAGDMAAGDRGLLSWPGREHELQDSVAVAVGIGSRLGTTAFNVLYGNRLPDVSPQQQDELAVAGLAGASAAAAAIDAAVLLEPVSGAPRYPLRTADEVVAVIERVERETGAGAVRLLADLYHLSVNGDDLTRAVADHAARIGHVQVADAPGRHEPGSGGLALDGCLRLLEATGYTGWVALEYVPSGTTGDSLAWLPRERRARALSPTTGS